MAEFQKIEVVEAEKYEGAPLTVVHESLGEQKALSGDYLLGSERGKIRVMKAKDFEAEFKPYTTTPEDELLASAQAEIVELKAEIVILNASSKDAADRIEQAQAEIAGLSAQITDQKQTKEQNTALTQQIATEQAKSTELQGRIDALLAVEKQRSDAEQALEAAQAAAADLTK